MTLDVRIEEALRSSDRVRELRRLAHRLLDEGIKADTLLSAFERAREHLRSAHRDQEEDAVMDAMDFLTGWCSPHMKLPDRD
jgi:hypothetical protein